MSLRRSILPALTLWCGAGAFAQVAPGPLSRAHQQLDSITRCGSCHEVGRGTSGFKCLECHLEIRRRVQAGAGFHGRNYKNLAGETDCRRCHAEHKGKDVPLIRLDRQNFAHQGQTGFALEGKHRQQKCEACHNASKVAPAARAEVKRADPNHSFLGLRRECLACHKDQHQSQLGSDCLRCHTMEGFKPASRFDHANTQFPLTGQHLAKPCQKCHGPKPGQDAAQFKGLQHGSCQNCHEDPHRGAFQDAQFPGVCATCHNTGGWKNNRPGSNFTHSAAKFQMSGKHTALECAKCHKTADFHRPIPHQFCRDCHQDPHRGQFANRALGSDCSACHNATGFKPAKFDRETHRQSAFPLDGKHGELSCGKCHQPEGRDALFKLNKRACTDCHADRHRGQFEGGTLKASCDNCHAVTGFLPTKFNVERHAQTRFPLMGKHASVECQKCHKPLVDLPQPAVPRQYRFASLSCNACHADPHQTKLACETCHTPEQWQKVRPFDHSTTGFRLEAAHQNPKCVQCHKPVDQQPAGAPKTAPHLAETPKQCSGCHAAKDAHAGQFTEGARFEDCSNCHLPVRWNGDNFSHDRMQFVLNRVHSVECVKCHKQQRQAAGKMVRLYRGTPMECIKCH